MADAPSPAEKLTRRQCLERAWAARRQKSKDRRDAGIQPPLKGPRIPADQVTPYIQALRDKAYDTLTLKTAHTIVAAPKVKRTILPSGKYHYEEVPGTGSTTVYGPGRVHVKPDLAAVLREMERRVEENNAAFDGTMAAFIGPQNRIIRVAPALFDNSMFGVPEAFTF